MGRIKQLLGMGILFRMMGRGWNRDPHGQAGMWTGITELLPEVEYHGIIIMGDKFPRCILQKMQLVAAEPGPVTGGGRFLHRALSDPTKGDFVILDPL